MDGERLVVGDTLVQDDLAGTLEILAEKGAAELYTGELGHEIADYLRVPTAAASRRRTSAITA